MSRRTGTDEGRTTSPEPVVYDDWREALESGTLIGVECDDCGDVTATPRRACAECGSRDLAGVELPQSGEVYSETTITVPPAGLEGPYRVAVVDLGPTRLLGRIDGDAGIGEPVQFVRTIEESGKPAPIFESE